MTRSVGSTMAPPTTASGRTAKNTQCQERFAVSHADTGGPTNDGSTQAVEMKVNSRGRCAGR